MKNLEAFPHAVDSKEPPPPYRPPNNPVYNPVNESSTVLASRAAGEACPFRVEAQHDSVESMFSSSSSSASSFDWAASKTSSEVQSTNTSMSTQIITHDEADDAEAFGLNDEDNIEDDYAMVNRRELANDPISYSPAVYDFLRESSNWSSEKVAGRYPQQEGDTVGFNLEESIVLEGEGYKGELGEWELELEQGGCFAGLE